MRCGFSRASRWRAAKAALDIREEDIMVSTIVMALEREDFGQQGATGSGPEPVQVQAGLTPLDANLAVPPRSRGLVLFAHGSGSSPHNGLCQPERWKP
jgi:hypothetical protein